MATFYENFLALTPCGASPYPCPSSPAPRSYRGTAGYGATRRRRYRLGEGQLREIALLQTRGIVERLAGLQITAEIDDSALDLIAQKGYDPVYGARPLKRVIQKEIETPVSRMIIAGELLEGGGWSLGCRGGLLDGGLLPRARGASTFLPLLCPIITSIICHSYL